MSLKLLYIYVSLWALICDTTIATAGFASCFIAQSCSLKARLDAKNNVIQIPVYMYKG